MLSLGVAAAGSTLDPGVGAPGAGSEADDLPLIFRTPTFSVPPIGHRSTVFLDLLTALDGGLRMKLHCYDCLAWPSTLGIHPQNTANIRTTLEIALPARPDSPRIVPETADFLLIPGDASRRCRRTL